jgi:hypothetical protein
MSVVGHELLDIEWTTARFVVVVLAPITAAFHFALATTTGNTTFAVLAVGLLAGFMVFFTTSGAVLYLVGRYVGIMTVIWVFNEMPFSTLAIVDKAVQAAFSCCLSTCSSSRRGLRRPTNPSTLKSALAVVED